MPCKLALNLDFTRRPWTMTRVQHQQKDLYSNDRTVVTVPQVF